MGRKDFVSFKKKSAFLGMAKKMLGSKGGKFGKKKDETGWMSDLFFSLFESVVFKDELREYVTSIINNSEPNEYVWDDERVPVTSTRSAASAPGFAAFPSGENTFTHLFDKTSEEQLFFTLQIPHKWMTGTNLYPHVHWAPTDSDTGSVVWGLDYSWADINGTFGANTTITVTDAGDGTANKHQLAEFSEIDGSGISGVSSMLVGRLYRDATNGDDDYNADAALLEFDFHIKIDSRGSSQETIK